MTKNDLRYQIDLLFSDKELMQPHNFNVPNKKNPFELPNYNTYQLDEPNTGIFYENT